MNYLHLAFPTSGKFSGEGGHSQNRTILINTIINHISTSPIKYFPNCQKISRLPLLPE